LSVSNDWFTELVTNVNRYVEAGVFLFSFRPRKVEREEEGVYIVVTAIDAENK
jgi:hypothetical protein